MENMRRRLQKDEPEGRAGNSRAVPVHSSHLGQLGLGRLGAGAPVEDLSVLEPHKVVQGTHVRGELKQSVQYERERRNQRTTGDSDGCDGSANTEPELDSSD